MSRSNTRRRLSLLTGGSMLAALVMAGAGGAILAPTATFAANECGDPATNAAAADTFTCTGSFAAISYPATNGNLTLNLQNNLTTTTGGLVISATGANTVTIGLNADSPANSGDPSLTSTSGAGLSVTSAAGGAISINLSEPFFGDTTDTSLLIAGTTAGVLLQNAGAAATTFTTTNGAISASAGAGIDVTSLGTGAVTITSGSATSGSTWGVRAGTTGAGAVIVTINGAVTGGTGAVLITGGTSATLTNGSAGAITGAVTLNNTGAAGFTNNGAWTSTGVSALGAGATTLTNNAAGRIITSGATTFDFAAGADSFSNAGALVAGGGVEGAATLTFAGLETWSNSGAVLFGSNADGDGSDGVANDRIVSPGAVFTGSGASTLRMDVDFGADQASCAAAVTADCLDLRGSSAAGSTRIVVRAVGEGLPMAERIVLVDVAGAGTSGASRFSLDATSSDYRLIGTTATVEQGMFFYALDYDAAAQQHVLAPVAFDGKALELARLGYAASEPWRTATGMWRERQSDLRGASGGVRPGVWLKAVGTVTNETRFDLLDVGAQQIGYNTSSQQRTTAIVGGVDLAGMYGDDGAWVVGVTAGQLDSSLDHRVVTSELELDGYSFGLYATVIAGPVFIDAIVNSTSLDLTHLDFGQAFEGSAESIGYQVEAGYRLFRLNDDGAYLEPIAALSYVRTRIDDLTVGPVAGRFGDAASLRAALGLRVAGDLAMQAVTARLAFTGRVWKELDGEAQTTLSASFGDITIAEQGVDTLGDVGVALSLFAPGGPLSADLGYSLKFGDGYESSNASLSVRLNW